MRLSLYSVLATLIILIGVSESHAQGGIDTLAEAREAERGIDSAAAAGITLPEESIFESEESGSYTSIPLIETEDNGDLKAQGTTLWLHSSGGWYWNFFNYKSDSWAWVTDARKGGNYVNVDNLEAHLTHNSCYGNQSVSCSNCSSKHAFVRNSGVAVCKSSICKWACAEKSGYGRWCTPKWCG